LELKSWEKFEILRKTEYKTFFEMMKIEWIKNVLPDFKNIREWVEKVYYKFYSAEKEKEFWVLAIEIELIKTKIIYKKIEEIESLLVKKLSIRLGVFRKIPNIKEAKFIKILLLLFFN